MQLLDQLLDPPTGRLTFEVRERGKLIETFDEKNLIVVGSQQTHAWLLGGNVANNSLTKFGIGTNGAAPVFGNTSLTGQYANALTNVTYPAGNQVQFSFGLGSGDSSAFGMAIMEFGLLTGTGVLYARKVRSSALNFAADISLAGTWTISF
ncbi:hypothetical protein [Burkholderia anthina]|uniref:hypothetical protein n=1 Tax=Burkholderia anthina TaxID=179879 RepID=UPI001589D1BF|nr:hypothetical protein [Burkholderia anthina]